MLRFALRAVLETVRRRPLASALAAGLVLLTALAALPLDPQGPFDARTLEPLPDMRLEYPALGAAIEPLAALGWIVAGAPDYRVAGVSFLIWISALACAGSLVLDAAGSRLSPLASARRALAAAGGSVGLFVLYAAFALLVRLPGWKLSAEDPDIVLADLQSHTFGSHDGLVSAEESLLWHRSRGFHVVAVTEHDSPRRASEAKAVAERDTALPAAIAGVEWRWQNCYMLALGPEQLPDLPWCCSEQDMLDFIHKEHGGAVLALAWRLDAEGVRRLADCGVDGFEIANFGHPDLPEEVRSALLDEAARRGLVLVASSDWHGWGGFCRTWTAVRVRGASGMDRLAKAGAVLDALRSRSARDVIPVVAGRLGPPGALRAVFAPFVETARYATELSAERVFAWWVWAISLAGTAAFLRLTRLQPGMVLLAAGLIALGAPVAWCGGRLALARISGEAQGDLALWAGLVAIAIGLAGLAGSCLVLRELRRARSAGRS